MKNLLLILFAFTINLQNLYASHAMAVDINYECIGGNTYAFCVNFYRDCDGIAAPASVTLDFSSTSCSQNFTQTTSMSSLGGQEVSQLCPSMLPTSTCSNGSNAGVELYTYCDTITLPANCTDWVISYDVCCRNDMIDNLTSPNTQQLYVEAHLDNLNNMCNNSVSYSSHPVLYGCVGNNMCFNHGAIDVDGDSLAFTLVNPMDGANTPIPFLTGAGYSLANPILSSTAFAFDSTTGQMCWNPIAPQTCIISMKVEEWRKVNGVMNMVGSTIREMTMISMACNITSYPELSGGIQNLSGGNMVDSVTINLCSGDTIAFDLLFADPDSNSILSVSSNASHVLPSSSFSTSGSNPIIASFYWVAQSTNQGSNIINFTVINDNCPVYSQNAYNINLNVLGNTYAGPDKIYCQGGIPVQLDVIGGSQFTWTPSVGLSCTNCSDPVATPQTTTSYIVNSNLQSMGCPNPNIDTVTVYVATPYSLDIGPDTTVCYGNQLSLTPSIGINDTNMTFSWQPPSDLSSSNICCPIASPDTSIKYYLTTTSSTGCKMVDSIDLSVLGQPLIINTPNNSFCQGDSFTLYADSGFTSYYWSIDGSTYLNQNISLIADSSIQGFSWAIDNNSCNISSDSFFININPLPNITIDTVGSIKMCLGSQTYLDAGSGYYSYLWNDGSTSQTISLYYPGGTYHVSVTGYNGCSNNSDTIIADPATLLNLPPNTSICYGDSAIIDAGNGFVSYTWNNGDTNQILTVKNTGSYYVLVTDSNNCQTPSDTTSIISGLPPANIINYSSLSFACGGNVTLSAGNYYNDYLWNTGDTTYSINTSSPGNYYVLTSDQIGCYFYSDTISVTVTPNNFNLSASASPALLTSTPFSIQFFNNTPNLSSYNFTWDFGDGTVISSNNSYVFHQYQFNGLYDVTLYAENLANGCRDTIFYDDMVYCSGGTGCNHSALIAQTGTLTGCDGDTIELNCNSNPSYLYQWKLNGVSISGATNDTLYATQSGVYSVMIIENNCPVYSQGVTISLTPAPNKPTITAVGSIAPCTNSTMDLQSPSGYSSYQWSNGFTSQNITISTSGSYILTVYNGSGCSAISDPYSVNASNVQPPDICVVTVDSATGRNMVVWEKPTSTAIDSFYIYKESNVAGVYSQIGAQSVNDFSTFVDTAANPMVRAYRYQIAIVDSCGNFTAPSSHHLTIHLTISQGLGGSYNLMWTPYMGFAYGTYNIYRGSTPSNMTLLTSIASSYLTYTDLNPPIGTSYYQIEVVNPNGCSPTLRSASYAVSRSNVADNGVYTSITKYESGKLKIYPNPFDKSTTLEFTNDGLETFSLEVYDMLGSRVRRVDNIMTDRVVLEKGELNSGIYFIELRSETHTLKGKVLVE